MKTQNDSMAFKAGQMAHEMISWRRSIHANPELSFREFETSNMVANILKSIPGMRVETGVGTATAVVGTLSSGEGPTIAIRADMDALPIVEANHHSFVSGREGVMHACGHDAHTSILLGVAHLLAERFHIDEVKGTVKFIFQPAEEDTDENQSTGAPYMIKTGVLDHVDCILALHMSPENPVGEVKVNAGFSMANLDVFTAKIHGTGGHGAYPHLGTDPIWMLGPVLQALHGIVARKVSPLDAAVISVGEIKAGSASNIIPTEVNVRGTMRSYKPDIRGFLISELEKAFSIVELLGGSYTFHITPGEPALYNDPRVNQFLKETIRDLYPDCKLIETPFGLASEDFSHMTNVVPGAMYFLGCAIPDGVKRDLHTPIFDIDETCLPMGAAIMAETAIRFLNKQYTLQTQG